MADLLIDTDVFVDHLRGARRIRPAMIGSYSVITRAELFAGSERDELAVEALLAPHSELAVDRGIAERAGKLRGSKGLSMPDALIAATALVRRLELVTRNSRDFSRVSELRVRHPADLDERM